MDGFTDGFSITSKARKLISLKLKNIIYKIFAANKINLNLINFSFTSNYLPN